MGAVRNVFQSIVPVFQRYARLRHISRSNNPGKQSAIHMATPILPFSDART